MIGTGPMYIAKKNKRHSLSGMALALMIMTAVGSGAAVAGPREQAKRMHDRLAGVPPTEAVLTSMAGKISSNNAVGAAMEATDNKDFYNVTLKNFAMPWTNEAQTVFAPLNDYVATVIGIVRDDLPFTDILSGDVLYVATGVGSVPAYSMNNNDHYVQLELQGIDLKANLNNVLQSSMTTLPAAATAGVMTSRAAAQAFFIDGTNRAMLRFTLLNHLCTDLEQIKDVTGTPDRIRQDVTRSPGGDSRIFMNACIGCHIGMDPLTQAFAYYEYDKAATSLVYNDVGQTDPATGSRVQAKYLINSDNFKPGFITTNDNWDNYWRKGPNRSLGWDGVLPGSGSGAKSMGQELAKSDAFATCQVQKVFKNVCLRSPVDAADRSQISTMVTSFKASSYSLKQVFAESAVYCMGQ